MLNLSPLFNTSEDEPSLLQALELTAAQRLQITAAKNEVRQCLRLGIPRVLVERKPPAQPPLRGGCSQRQQLIQPAIRPGRQLLQRIFQPRTRLDTVQFGCRQQTLDRRRPPTRAL
jgi:hypothetical protein